MDKYIAYSGDVMWFVDEVYNYNHPERSVYPIYDEMTELQAKTVVAIMNDGIGPDWDSIENDYRWLLVKSIGR